MPTATDIRSVRLDLKETQAEFGARFGVDQSTVHRWETEGLPTRGVAKTTIERFISEVTAAPAPTPTEAA